MGFILLLLLQWTCFLAGVALANTEKTIFTVPDGYRPSSIAASDQVQVLNVAESGVNSHFPGSLWDTDFGIKRNVAASLIDSVRPHYSPDDEKPEVSSKWYQIVGLTPGKTYEARICWPASHPSEVSVYHTFSNRPHHDETAVAGQQVFVVAQFYAGFFCDTCNPDTLPAVPYELVVEELLFSLIPLSLCIIIAQLLPVGILCYLFLAPFLYSRLLELASRKM